MGFHFSISFSRGPSQPRNQTHVADVSCIGKWVLYHQRHLALRVKGLNFGAFLVDQASLSSPRPLCVFCPLGPCYRSFPLLSSLPPCSGPFFKPQNRNTPVRGPTPPPRASLQTAPRGSDLSSLGLPEFHLPSPSFSMQMHCWPLSASDFQLECHFNKE